MLKRLFGGTRKSRGGPPHRRAYAIGDVHGRLDLLRQLIADIEADNASRPPARTYLVFLGDLVDRGPASKGVLDYLIEKRFDFATPIFLKGNHEEFFQRVLEGDETGVLDWLTYGGFECAESYGVSRGSTLNSTAAAIVKRLQEAVPDAHRDFLDRMADTFRFGDYLFVHAGIRPGVAIDQQSPEDLRWIREEFLDHGSSFGKTVVHGHTVTEKVEVKANRIGIDTGAYQSGRLTALGLEGEEQWFLST